MFKKLVTVSLTRPSRPSRPTALPIWFLRQQPISPPFTFRLFSQGATTTTTSSIDADEKSEFPPHFTTKLPLHLGSNKTPDVPLFPMLLKLSKELKKPGDFHVFKADSMLKSFSPLGSHSYMTGYYICQLAPGLDLTDPAIQNALMRMWRATFPGSEGGAIKVRREGGKWVVDPDDDGTISSGDFFRLNPGGKVKRSDYVFVNSVSMGPTMLAVEVKTSVEHSLVGTVNHVFVYNPLNGMLYLVQLGEGGDVWSPGPLINSGVAVHGVKILRANPMWRMHGEKLELVFEYVLENGLGETLEGKLSPEEWNKLRTSLSLFRAAGEGTLEAMIASGALSRWLSLVAMRGNPHYIK